MKKVSIWVLILAMVVSMIPLASSDSGWDGPCLHTSCDIISTKRTSITTQTGNQTHHNRKYTIRYNCLECGRKNLAGAIWEPEPHTWGNWVLVETPSAVSHGKKKHTCTVCGQTVTKPCY